MSQSSGKELLSEKEELNSSYSNESSLLYVILACAIGGFLDFYDYALVSYFADEISDAFFPFSSNNDSKLLKAFSLYGIGYIARPIGAIIGGYNSDYLGRRNTLIKSILCISVPTFLVGCTPNYNLISYWSTVIVFLLRFVQGIAYGMEYGTSIVYIYEACINNNNKNDNISKLQYAMGIFWPLSCGNILTAILRIILDYSLNKNELYYYGWRIPFWLSIVLMIIGLKLRLLLPKTTAFLDLSNNNNILNNPVSYVVKNISQYYIVIILLCMSYNSCLLSFTIAFIWMPDYLDNLHKPKINVSFYGNLYSSIIVCIVLIAFGKLLYKYNILSYKSSIYTLLPLTILNPIIFIVLAYTKSNYLIIFEQIIFGSFYSLNIPCILSFCVVYVSDSRILCTITSLSYNLASIIGCAISPEILTLLVGDEKILGMLYSGLITSLFYVISIFSIKYLNNNSFKETVIKNDYKPIQDLEITHGIKNTNIQI